MLMCPKFMLGIGGEQSNVELPTNVLTVSFKPSPRLGWYDRFTIHYIIYPTLLFLDIRLLCGTLRARI
jgi:hypothetical protein